MPESSNCHEEVEIGACYRMTPNGLDDDLTPLQQKQKYAAWAKFKEARAQGLKTRWEAEKLYIKEDEKWVVHRVCATY